MVNQDITCKTMTTKELDCKKCNVKTTHQRRSNQSNGEAVYFGIFTLGFSVAARQFWWKCIRCGNVIE